MCSVIGQILCVPELYDIQCSSTVTFAFNFHIWTVKGNVITKAGVQTDDIGVTAPLTRRKGKSRWHPLILRNANASIGDHPLTPVTTLKGWHNSPSNEDETLEVPLRSAPQRAPALAQQSSTQVFCYTLHAHKLEGITNWLG